MMTSIGNFFWYIQTLNEIQKETEELLYGSKALNEYNKWKSKCVLEIQNIEFNSHHTNEIKEVVRGFEG